MFCNEAPAGRGRPAVLAIGGIDPTGGAGLSVDAAAIRAAGAHPAAVCAVATVQTGGAFLSSSAADPAAVIAAAGAALAALNVRAAKTGALGTAAVALAVAELAARAGFPPLVVDPVLASTTGGALIDAGGAAVLRERLAPLAALVTPNLAEAAVLSGGSVEGVDAMLLAGERILSLGCRAVLVKGGHLPGGDVVDVFLDRGGARRVFREPRLPVGEVRGTGCALASLAAAHLALGRGPGDAVELARAALRRALARSYESGDGPRLLELQGS